MNFSKRKSRRAAVVNAGYIGPSRPLWLKSSGYQRARRTIRNPAAFAKWAELNPEDKQRAEMNHERTN